MEQLLAAALVVGTLAFLLAPLVRDYDDDDAPLEQRYPGVRNIVGAEGSQRSEVRRWRTPGLCQECGSDNDPSYSFCRECGTYLS